MLADSPSPGDPLPVSTALRLNMTGHSDDPTLESARYRTAIEMAGFAEKHGFSVVSDRGSDEWSQEWGGNPRWAGVLLGGERLCVADRG